MWILIFEESLDICGVYIYVLSSGLKSTSDNSGPLGLPASPKAMLFVYRSKPQLASHTCVRSKYAPNQFWGGSYMRGGAPMSGEEVLLARRGTLSFDRLIYIYREYSILYPHTKMSLTESNTPATPKVWFITGSLGHYIPLSALARGDYVIGTSRTPETTIPPNSSPILTSLPSLSTSLPPLCPIKRHHQPSNLYPRPYRLPYQ